MSKKAKSKKLFVLDTNVLIYDPSSLFRFKEHDLYIPMVTLEELDTNKKGSSDVARSCRQASRFINDVVTSNKGSIDSGFELSEFNGGNASGRLFLQNDAFAGTTLPFNIPTFKGDNEILRVVHGLRSSSALAGREVILVSKDINLRLKGAAMKITTEDYLNDNVIEDADLLHTGMLQIDESFWGRHQILSSGHLPGSQGATFYDIEGPEVGKWLPNMLVHGFDGAKDFLARVQSRSEGKARLVSLKDHANSKNSVWGIQAKNLEQNFALNLLLDPEIHLISILGQAGSGKTMLTLAASLHMLFDLKRHTEMIFTRITVPVGEEIGFLPGTEEEKMMPWMGALQDNLEFLAKPLDNSGDWGRKATADLITSKIKVKSMTFMRGRTFVDKILVVDEAQNLTPKQMKTLVTRAGMGTKVVCLGNIAQIDTPYLTESSCGLTYLVERMKGWERYGHVTLARVERSPLADYASSVL